MIEIFLFILGYIILGFITAYTCKYLNISGMGSIDDVLALLIIVIWPFVIVVGFITLILYFLRYIGFN